MNLTSQDSSRWAPGFWRNRSQAQLAKSLESERGSRFRLHSQNNLREPNDRIRVLLISHTCQSSTEGQPKARCLAEMPEIDLCVLAPDRWRHYGKWRAAQRPEPGGFAFEAGAVAWPWAGPAQNYLHWYPGLRRLVERFRPHVIDLWEEPWGLVSAQVCHLRNRLFPEIRILSETEQNINKRLPFAFELFRAYTLANADFAIGRNAHAIAVLRAKGYTGLAQIVPNAVDADLFRPMSRVECRGALGLRGFVIGYVGRIVPEKGLMEMVEALPLAGPEVNLLFVGDGDYAHTLKQRASELHQAGRIRFLGGQPLGALPQIMNALDVLVLPSRTTPRWKEQFGRVIIEALACATPVIGSDSGAIPEVIGEAGLVFPERNVLALANAINALHSSPSMRERLGALGRRRVLDHFTWKRVAEQMRDIYLTLAPSVVGTGEASR